MSVLPSGADIVSLPRHVRLVPISDLLYYCAVCSAHSGEKHRLLTRDGPPNIQSGAPAILLSLTGAGAYGDSSQIVTLSDKPKHLHVLGFTVDRALGFTPTSERTSRERGVGVFLLVNRSEGPRMTIESLIGELFGPTSILVANFGAVYAFATLLDTNCSDAARLAFADYLKSEKYVRSVVTLPEATRELFERIFGRRHFSLRCFARSVVFSLFASIGALTFGAFHSTFSPSDCFSWMISPSDTYFAGITDRWGLLSWLAFSLLLDYFGLLKTRLFISWFANRFRATAWFALSFIVADIVIGFVIFCLSFGSFTFFRQEIEADHGVLPFLGIFFDYSYTHLPSHIADYAVLTLTGDWFPWGSLFLASMLPSIWLWLYGSAAMITKLMLRSTGLIRNLIFLLDVDKHPIRAFGFVAGIVAAATYAIYLIAISLSFLLLWLAKGRS